VNLALDAFKFVNNYHFMVELRFKKELTRIPQKGRDKIRRCDAPVEVGYEQPPYVIRDQCSPRCMAKVVDILFRDFQSLHS